MKTFELVIRTLIALLCAMILAPTALAGLDEYDAAIAADNAGGLPYAAVLTSAITLDGTVGVPFDFGAIGSGAATSEFILEGDPVAGGQDAYLAVGTNSDNSLRYEQWDDTGNLGFTRAGVFDYDLGVASPTTPTHIAYRWDGAGKMDLYLDGGLVGTVDGATFEMPTGAGSLGANLTDAEQMVGTIFRVTTYDGVVDPADIEAHAAAWLIPEPSTFALLGLGALSFWAGFIRRR